MSLGQQLVDSGYTLMEVGVFDVQLEWMRQTVDFTGKSTLELGARDGRHSIAALELGARDCTAVDGRANNALKDPRVKWIIGNALFSPLLPFDVDIVMCYGLLYHLPDPAALIKRMAVMAREWIIISTHCVTDAAAIAERGGYWGQLRHEGTSEIDALNPEPSESLWLTHSELYRCLQDNGFRAVSVADYVISNQPAVWVAARRFGNGD